MTLLTPTIYVKKVTDISPELLKKMDVDSIILDVDDTIAAHSSPIPLEGTVRWIETMKQNKIKIIIVSNNYKKRVKPMAQKLRLPFVWFSLKPLPFGLKRAVKALDSSVERAVVIGDQIFTDILGANLSGIKSILTEPVSSPKKATLILKRKLEKPIRKKLKLYISK